MKCVAFLSGGISSWANAKRSAERYGVANLVLLFTDTLIEDADLYRFLVEAAANVVGRRLNWPVPAAEEFPATYLTTPPGAEPQVNPAWLAFLAELRERATAAIPELVWIADGRTPWQVFGDKRFIGNSRRDPCSEILKRKLALAWLRGQAELADAVLTFGIGWDEPERFDDGKGHGLRHRWAKLGYLAEATMLAAPWMRAEDLHAWLRLEGLRRPRLYDLGFAHNNCGGFCVKAGDGHFAHLLRTLPEVYAHHEAAEAAFNAARPGLAAQTVLAPRRYIGARRVREPMTLAEFRQHVNSGGEVDLFDIGGCDCFGATNPRARV